MKLVHVAAFIWFLYSGFLFKPEAEKMLCSGFDTELVHHMMKYLETKALGNLLGMAVQLYPQEAKERN